MRRLSSTFGRISDKENDCFYLNTTNDFYPSSLIQQTSGPFKQQPQPNQQFYCPPQLSTLPVPSVQQQQVPPQSQQQYVVTRGQIATSRCVSQERIRCCYIVPPQGPSNRRESLLPISTTIESGPNQLPSFPSVQATQQSIQHLPKQLALAPSLNTSIGGAANPSPRYGRNDIRTFKARIFDGHPPTKTTVMNPGPAPNSKDMSIPKRPALVTRPRRQGEKPEYQYASPILSTLLKKSEKFSSLNCLQLHNVTQSLRGKMVDWMVEVYSSYKCRDDTLFVGVNILDRFFKESKHPIDGKDVHLLGIVSMLLSTKYEEIFPFRMSIVHDKIAHRKFTPEEIRAKEREMLNVLNFDFTGVTPFELAKTIGYILFPQLHSETSDQAGNAGKGSKTSHLDVCLSYLAKMALHDYEIISSFKYHEIAGALVIAALKLMPSTEIVYCYTEERANHIRDILHLQESRTSSLVGQLIALYRNFDTKFPNLVNLKKFNPVDPFIEGNRSV